MTDRLVTARRKSPAPPSVRISELRDWLAVLLLWAVASLALAQWTGALGALDAANAADPETWQAFMG